MNDNNKTAGLIIGAVVIVIGLSLLGEIAFPNIPVLGEAWQDMARVTTVIRHSAGPLLLIGLGILLVVRSREGGFSWQPKTGHLYRSRSDKWVAGVIGGLAQYTGLDAVLLRIIFIVAVTLLGWGGLVFAYVVAAILVPEEPVGYVSGPTTGPFVGREPSPPAAPSAPAPRPAAGDDSPLPPPPPAPPGGGR